jgi:hypothetical protein
MMTLEALAFCNLCHFVLESGTRHSKGKGAFCAAAEKLTLGAARVAGCTFIFARPSQEVR